MILILGVMRLVGASWKVMTQMSDAGCACGKGLEIN